MTGNAPEGGDRRGPPATQDDPHPEWGFNEVDPEIETAPGTIEIDDQQFPYDRYGRVDAGGEVFVDSFTGDTLFHALGISDSDQNVPRLEIIGGSDGNATFDLSADGDGDALAPGSYVVINAISESEPRAFQPLCVRAYDGTLTEVVSGPTPTVTVTTTPVVDNPPSIDDPQLVAWNETQGEQRVSLESAGDGSFEGTLDALPAGTYSLHALLRDGPEEGAQVLGLSDVATVEVVAQTGLTFAVDDQPDAVTLTDGETAPYDATAEFEDGSQEDVTGQVDVTVTDGDPAVVDVDAGAAEVGATAPGTVTLTADDGQFTDTVDVTVEAPSQTGLTFAVDGQSDTVTLSDGETAPYTATATFEDGSQEDVTGQVDVTVTDGDPAVVDVDAGAAEVGATAPGTVTLTADDGQFTDTVDVTVEAVLVSLGFEIDGQPDTVTVDSGETAPYSATAVFSDGSEDDVTDDAAVTSADPAVVSVDQTATQVTGETAGEAVTTTATYETETDTVAVTVPAGGTEVTLPDATAPPGTEVELTIEGTAVETLTIADLWTDWDVSATAPDGAETTDEVASTGEFELTWESQQVTVAPTVAVTPPDRYASGQYELTATGAAGEGESGADTAILTIDGSA